MKNIDLEIIAKPRLYTEIFTFYLSSLLYPQINDRDMLRCVVEIPLKINHSIDFFYTKI